MDRSSLVVIGIVLLVIAALCVKGTGGIDLAHHETLKQLIIGGLIAVLLLVGILLLRRRKNDDHGLL